MNNNKLWVFQSVRNLTDEEESDIKKIISNFLQSWAAHGDDLKSEFRILNHKFIIIEADENYTKASGCSIDSLNKCIKEIDAKYHLDLLNRLWVSYETENEITTISMNEFKEKIKQSQISSDSFVYNLSVSSSQEFNEKFKMPINESWAKIYM